MHTIETVDGRLPVISLGHKNQREILELLKMELPVSA